MGQLAVVDYLAAGKRQAGFTLVELVVTLTIFLLILLLTSALSRTWGANAHISTAESQLHQAFYRTRALALRNITAASSTAAATLKINSSSTLSVLQGSSGTIIWTGSVDSDTSISLQNASCINQLGLDSNGLALNSNCLSYQVSAPGGDTRTGQFY